MEETLRRKPLHNSEKMHDSRFNDIAVFAKKVCFKYPSLVASNLVTRPSISTGSIEFLMVLDDLNNVVFDPDRASIEMSVSEMAYESTLPLKCKTLLASELWDSFKARDESALEIFRQGLVVTDNGFFAPLQDLLVKGKIRPAKESVKVYFVKSEHSLKAANEHVAKAVLDLYWAVTDSAHAAVMIAGITPPSPKDLALIVKKDLVSRNLVHPKCAEVLDRIYDVAKKIMHHELFEISGRDFDNLFHDADFFVHEMDEFVREHVKE